MPIPKIECNVRGQQHRNKTCDGQVLDEMLKVAEVGAAGMTREQKERADHGDWNKYQLRQAQWPQLFRLREKIRDQQAQCRRL